MSEKIVGRNPVMEALRSGAPQIEKILIAQGNENRRIREIIDAATWKGIPFQRSPRHLLDRQDPNHQGVIAFICAFQYSDLSIILKKVQNKKDVPPVLLMLDQIQDPRNLGAIIRTANAVEADGVIIPKNNAAEITASVHKASSGSTAYIPISKVTNLAQTIEQLKSIGIWVVGTSDDAETSYTSADYTVPLCIVLGNEGSGIRRLVKQKCDYLVHLPMLGQISSLNVSVTAGVLLYEVLRQRGTK
ncbi:23S rRNA (guanosine(2251)-2'-O)-methyltransferase RlmB [Candidatus Poribacteria bacterium]|nr:23S rRNA (guanosine(2251)-2'-O)-methyltransferase RlmB [Candidatus Poribacteria bacterium]MYF54354.1 23S rRNA (guanosine(2251)-2'-O)-methyltransferase RlmB [Candidatus Poribacteria bacterium]MYI93094.1 23S rRNA (guanosine(2251)-2'-O)-methyltransferase RlmB [Candidatus Poribacteria bacterium]